MGRPFGRVSTGKQVKGSDLTFDVFGSVLSSPHHAVTGAPISILAGKKVSVPRLGNGFNRRRGKFSCGRCGVPGVRRWLRRSWAGPFRGLRSLGRGRGGG